MSGKAEPFIQEIITLHAAGNYNGVINLIHDVYQSSFQDKSKVHLLHLISWPTPTEKDLACLASVIYSLRVSHIHSIGCGTGLLEWLLCKALLQHYLTSDDDNVTKKIEVTGIEGDFKWWKSSYAPPTFIPLQFVGKDFAAENPFGDFDDMAMFCYSNSITMFKHYVGAFQGAYVLIIGPLSGSETNGTDNENFADKFNLEDLPDSFKLPKSEWKLILLKSFGLVKTDHVAIYKRIEKTFELPPRKNR
jgi:hypothetical protein